MRSQAARGPALQDQHLEDRVGRYRLQDGGQRSLHGKHGFISRVHRKKPKGRPIPEPTRRANNMKSKVRSRVEHVFAEQKGRMRLFIRPIGIARATTKIGLANILYNMKRLIHLDRIAVA